MRRPATWVLLLFLLLSLSCGSSARELLQQAEARWREGNYPEAIRLNTLLYDRDRHGKYGAQALLNIGNIYYLNLRVLKNAVETYNKLVEEFPGRPEESTARQELAAIYANEIGDLTQAIFEYDKILESKELENRMEILFQRANAYFSKEDYDRALRELRRLEEDGVNGHLADQVHLKIGNIYQVRHKFEDAAASFQKVTESPCIECRRRATLHLMETYDAVYDFDRAIETVRKLDHTPENDARILTEVSRLSAKQRRLNNSAAALELIRPSPSAKSHKPKVTKKRKPSPSSTPRESQQNLH